MSNLENDMKWSTQKTIVFQAGIIKLCSKEIGTGGDVEERLEKIENYLKSGKMNVTQNNNINYNVGPANYNGSNIGTNAVVNNGVGPKMSMGANARMNTSTMPNNIGNSKSTTVRASTTTKKIFK